MPKGIYQRSEETKEKIRMLLQKYRTGNSSGGMKGKLHSEETRKKMRENHKGMLGRRHSEETKRKIGLANSIALKGKIRIDLRLGEDKQCLYCHKEFYAKRDNIKRGWGKFCSNKCKWLFKKDKPIPWFKGIKYKATPGSFKKGLVPWNYKGGISKTKEYAAFYKRRRKLLQRNIFPKHTLKEWVELKKQYNYTCPCCNRKEPEIKLTIDHIIPLAKNGKDTQDNIQPLCVSCNSKKNTKIIRYIPVEN